MRKIYLSRAINALISLSAGVVVDICFGGGLTKLLERYIRISVDVQQLRQRLGMSRDALARKLGVTYKTIYLWEKGKNKPSPMAQQKLEELERQLK